MRKTMQFLVLLLVSSPVLAEVPSLRALDALALPASAELPQMEPLATSDPREKVVGRLWQKAMTQASDETLRVIITLRKPLLPAALGAEEAEELRLSSVRSLAHSFVGKARELGAANFKALSHFPIVFADVAPSALARVAAIEEVASIEDNMTVKALRVEGAALMRANQLRSAGGTGNGIGVAVLDTGVANHAEFAGRLVVQGNYTESPGDGTSDVDGHGTGVAGVIAGSGGGMAPQATIWSLKVLGDDGSGSEEWVLAALNDAFANRGSFGGLDFINMSLGPEGAKHNSHCDGEFPSYATAFNQLVNAGILVFVASGNDGFLDGVGTPACLSNAIAVGAVFDAVGVNDPGCPEGTPTAPDAVTCYSNSGEPLDLLAPSGCATTTKNTGGTESCFNGTSAATPYAVGVAAQLKSLHGTVTASQLKSVMMSTGKPITDQNGITRGRVDGMAAHAALGGSGGTGPCTRSATVACLANGRFEVSVDWRTASSSGIAQVMGFGGKRAENNDSAFYWFFTDTNFEMGLKILDACSLNNKFWVFISGLTNQGWTAHIRDSQTGATKTYSNPTGTTTATTADTAALSCP